MARRLPDLRGAVARGAHRLGYEIVPEPSRIDRRYPDLDPAFAALHRTCAPYTATTVERMYALHEAVKHVVANGVEGDLVETGVWRGGSSMLAALTLEQAGDHERRLWLYDTFAGMPKPTTDDISVSGRSALEDWEAHPGHLSDDLACEASLDEVRANLRGAGVALERCELVQGLVQDTIPARAPERIALLRLDTDWYESTRHELEQLYPRLVPGGVLLLDDYGHWEGSRRAVDEYFAGHGPRPLLVRLDVSGRIAVKTAA
jgi:hypothetical protein